MGNANDNGSLNRNALTPDPIPEQLQASVAEAVQILVAQNIGSLLVCRGDTAGNEKILGIITERDILRCIAKNNNKLDSIPVSQIMTSQLITASPEDSVSDVLNSMKNHAIRHVPVLSSGRLDGMISVRDLTHAEHVRLATENESLTDYIVGKR